MTDARGMLCAVLLATTLSFSAPAHSLEESAFAMPLCLFLPAQS